MIRLGSVRKYRKQYAILNKERKAISLKYEKYIEEGCSGCEKYFCGSVNKYIERLSDCSSCNEYETRKKICSEFDDINEKIEKFMEEEYSYAIFQYGIRKNSKLINVKSGEIVSWEEVYGMDFEKVSKNLRYSLIGLIEDWGKYRFKRKLICMYIMNRKQRKG